MNKSIGSLLFLLFTTLCSCDRIYEKHYPLGDTLYWIRNDTLEFDVNIDHPDQFYDVIVGVRHAELYPFESIIVNLQCTNPSGKEIHITKDLSLVGEDGKFNGDAIGDIWDKEIMFKKKEKFQEKGKHLFRLTHQMATDTLPMVMEVGLIVERVKD